MAYGIKPYLVLCGIEYWKATIGLACAILASVMSYSEANALSNSTELVESLGMQDNVLNHSITKSIFLSESVGTRDTLKIIVPNRPPVAINDTISTNEDISVRFNVLANDFDVDGNHLSIISVIPPSNGTISVNANGTIVYHPKSNVFGSDSFSYVASDGRGGTSKGFVFLRIYPVNDAPVMADDYGLYSRSESVTINVLANDFDVEGNPLTLIGISAPSNGTATINPNHTITYIANQSIADSDSFNYIITDGNMTSQASVRLTKMSLDKIMSGLVAFDPLNNVTLTKEQLKNDTRYWRYDGSAISLFEPDAPHDFFQNSTGRYIGVQSPTDGTYAGFFGVTPQTKASLFHTIITTPTRTIQNNYFQNGAYVHTSDGQINYITCVSITSTNGTSWHIIKSFGNATQATKFDVLWSDTKPNQPLTRDCTIITNGLNYLKVYMDGAKVYENHTLALQMSSPFMYFTEVQNSHTDLLYGSYRDYYATTGESLTIVNLPENANSTQLINDNNTVIVAAGVDQNKRATLDIGALHFPISGKLRIVDSNGTEIISTGTQNFWGGDIYGITYPSVWKPKIGMSWNVQLKYPIIGLPQVEMFAIDTFDNSKSIVESLHANGTRVVCYLNMGSWEDWRSDATSFPDYVKGNDLVDFPGEKWLDIRQLDVIGPIMQKRLDQCKEKGFDGVDPDNVEAYKQDSGFPILYSDQLKYNNWIADEAHKRGLSVGLKNDLGQISDLYTTFDWGTNEQCNQFRECDFLKPFITINRPVFNIEYVESGQTTDKFCPQSIENRFDSILKNIELGFWYEPCTISNSTSFLRIKTELENGTSINGIFMTINYNQTSRTGFSPILYAVPNNQPITIQVFNFGNYLFDHWKDDTLLGNKRVVYLSNNSDFTAVYRIDGG